MVMPIGSAIVGLALSLSAIRLLENAIEVPSVAATLATMIGLGVGIDYALSIITRHKLQFREGMELRKSIARATATAGGAVVFAGFTVVINSMRVPGTSADQDDSEPHGWRKWARGVARRPWRSALAALAVLIVLALPIFQLELGQNDLSKRDAAVESE